MKIVHLIDYFQAQVGYQETFLAAAHESAGHEVVVVTSDRHFPIPDYDATWGNVLGPRLKGAGEFEEAGLSVRRLPTLWEVGNSLFLRGVPETLRELAPDVLILHNNESLLAVQVLLQLRVRPIAGMKLIVDNHANTINSNNRRLAPMYYRLYRRFVAPQLIRQAEGIVAIDEESREFLETSCAIPPGRITKIRLGADQARFRRSEVDGAELRAATGIHDDEVVFVQVGKLEAIKRPDLLLGAFASVVERVPNSRLMFVGSCPQDYWTSLSTSFLRPEVAERIIRVGTVDNSELYRYYSAADIAVWPGAVTAGTLEAQACGCPLIVSDSRLLLERIGGGNGISFRAGSERGLVEAMIRLATDCKMRAELAENGLREIESDLNWDVLAERFLELVDGG